MSLKISNTMGQAILMLTHSNHSSLARANVLFIKDGILYNQISAEKKTDVRCSRNLGPLLTVMAGRRIVIFVTNKVALSNLKQIASSITAFAIAVILATMVLYSLSPCVNLSFRGFLHRRGQKLFLVLGFVVQLVSHHFSGLCQTGYIMKSRSKEPGL